MTDRYFIMKLKSDSKEEIQHFHLDTTIEIMKAKANELALAFRKGEKTTMSLMFNTNEKLISMLE